MNALEYLESQHREVEKLFAELEAMPEKHHAGDQRRSLINQIVDALTLHANLEETFLYPLAKEIDDDLTLEAYEEHDVVKLLLKKLTVIRTNDETFMAKVTVLKEVVEHHVEEEEGHFFHELQKKLGEAKLHELGLKMQNEAETVKPGAGFERLDRPEQRVG